MKRVLIPLVGLSGALALAGCTSSAPAEKAPAPSTTPASSPASTPATTAAATAAATTSATAPPLTAPTTTRASTAPAAPGAGTGADLGKKIAAAMLAAGSGRATVSSTGAIAVTGQTEFLFVDATHLDTHATLKFGQQSLETVFKGGQLYIKGLPPASSGGKPWVRIDPKATDPVSKAMAGAVQQAGSPQSLSDAFNGSSATVVDTANGQTHYRLTGGQTRSGDLYVDGQNRPVRFLADASGTKLQVAYSDWGAPVTITVPPADQVGSLAPGG